jgi:MSHA biogenesis protein MshL
MHQRQIGDRSQLPGAGNLGGLDWLFGQKSTSTNKSELVILIKPTIIRDNADWQATQRESLDRLQEYAPSRPVVITQ